jgi:hypothetical protein
MTPTVCRPPRTYVGIYGCSEPYCGNNILRTSRSLGRLIVANLHNALLASFTEALHKVDVSPIGMQNRRNSCDML